MGVKVLYLCHDFMNLYGENGNIRILERALLEIGAEPTIDRKTVGDNIEFSEYDFIYMGSGTEAKAIKALEFLKQYREDLIEAVEMGKVLLFTGNSWNLFGKTLKTASGEVLDGLGIFGFDVEWTNQKRSVGDAVFECVGLDDFPASTKQFVGFINKCSSVNGSFSQMFKVDMGFGDNETDRKDMEGIVHKNFYGTNLIGPVLVKNPHFLKYVVAKLVKRQDVEIDCEYEERAYKVTLEALLKR